MQRSCVIWQKKGSDANCFDLHVDHELMVVTNNHLPQELTAILT